MARILSVLKCKCPNCEEGDVYKDNGSVFRLKLPEMRKECPVCGHTFEREPGYYWGAMYFSYALAAAEGIGVFILCSFFFEDPFDYRVALLVIAVTLLLSVLNFRYSRILWMYLFTYKKS